MIIFRVLAIDLLQNRHEKFIASETSDATKFLHYQARFCVTEVLR